MAGHSERKDLSTFRLRRRTPGSFLLIPCLRLGRSLRCQGQLEAAAATILANCPLVISIQEQPLPIWYAWRETSSGAQIRLLSDRPTRKLSNGIRHSYVVPDFLVGMKHGLVRLVEVKPSSQLDRPIVQRKLAVARAYARQRGWKYHVLTEVHLLKGPLLSNLRLLGRYRQTVVDSELANRLVEFVTDHRTTSVSLSEFAATVDGTNDSQLRLTLFHLLAIGRLDCDPVSRSIGDSTPLFPGGTHPWDPFDSAWGPNGCGTDVPSASSVNSPPDGSSSGTSISITTSPSQKKRS